MLLNSYLTCWGVHEDHMYLKHDTVGEISLYLLTGMKMSSVFPKSSDPHSKEFRGEFRENTQMI